MAPLPQLPPPEPTLIWTFVVMVYLLALGCVIGAWSMGRRHGGWGITREIGLIALFTGFYFLLESYALRATPFYFYAAQFPDLLPAVALPVPPGAVEGCLPAAPRQVVPLTVPLMEASLTYAVMWTGHLLRIRPWVLPFAAGFVFVVIDNFLDPVVAVSASCEPARWTDEGVGFWQWHVPEAVAAYWFGIPVFNFAAWYAAPVCLIALAHLLGSRAPSSPPPAHGVRRNLLIIAAGLVVVLFFSPLVPRLPDWLEFTLFSGVMLISLTLLLRSAAATGDERRVRLAFLLPPMALVVFALLVFLLDGQLASAPLLLPLGIVTVVLVWLYVWAPYERPHGGLVRRLRDVDRFVRLHYLGFPALLVIIGATSASAPVGAAALGWLLLVALCYNVFSYVSNDIIDLPVDRTQPKRALDPLVRGAVSVRQAWLVAAGALAASFGVSVLAGIRWDGYVYLLLAYAGMSIYNLWGKRVAVPLITDLVEGLAWACLALYGAAFVAGSVTTTTWLIFGYGTLFIFLINGIHGGLRDLGNDLACGKNTSAILLGGSVEQGRVVSTGRIVAFSFGVHALMTALAVAAWLLNAQRYSLGTLVLTGALLAALTLWSLGLLWRVVKPRNRARDAAISRSLFALLTAPVVVFAPQLDDGLGWILVLAFLLPLLALDPALEAARHALSSAPSRAGGQTAPGSEG